MVAVQVDHRLQDDQPQPDIERLVVVMLISGDPLGRVDVCILQNVVSVDAAGETGIKSKIHHPPQPGAMERKEASQSGFLARRQLLE